MALDRDRDGGVKPMANDRPCVNIVVGAPGCGKTTLAPYLAFLTDGARAAGLDPEQTSRLIDSFIDRYKDSPQEESQAVLSRVASAHGLDATRTCDPVACREWVAETGDHKGYHDAEGRVRRALTAEANALMLSRSVTDGASVLISGTGMAMHRFLPLLRSLPSAYFKVVVPIPGYLGYFKNSCQQAIAVRSGPAGVANGRSVEADEMTNLYARQEELWAPGGLWARTRGLHTGAELARIVESERSEGTDAEVGEIRRHFERFCSAPVRSDLRATSTRS